MLSRHFQAQAGNMGNPGRIATLRTLRKVGRARPDGPVWGLAYYIVR